MSDRLEHARLEAAWFAAMAESARLFSIRHTSKSALDDYIKARQYERATSEALDAFVERGVDDYMVESHMEDADFCRDHQAHLDATDPRFDEVPR